jgi:hypothetical protein
MRSHSVQPDATQTQNPAKDNAIWITAKPRPKTFARKLLALDRGIRGRQAITAAHMAALRLLNRPDPSGHGWAIDSSADR